MRERLRDGGAVLALVALFGVGFLLYYVLLSPATLFVILGWQDFYTPFEKTLHLIAGAVVLAAAGLLFGGIAWRRVT